MRCRTCSYNYFEDAFLSLIGETTKSVIVGAGCAFIEPFFNAFKKRNENTGSGEDFLRWNLLERGKQVRNI